MLFLLLLLIVNVVLVVHIKSVSKCLKMFKKFLKVGSKLFQNCLQVCECFKSVVRLFHGCF